MISLNTQPGAKIRCVDVDVFEHLTLGKVYTFRAWRTDLGSHRPREQLYVEEFDKWSFQPGRFELVEEPECSR